MTERTERVIVLLWASKADTYGPFPNANMVGAMGLARSTNLRSLLLTGWLVLIPASLMYVAILVSRTESPPHNSTAQLPAGRTGEPSEYARYEAGPPAHPAETWIRRFMHRTSGSGH